MEGDKPTPLQRAKLSHAQAKANSIKKSQPNDVWVSHDMGMGSQWERQPRMIAHPCNLYNEHGRRVPDEGESCCFA